MKRVIMVAMICLLCVGCSPPAPTIQQKVYWSGETLPYSYGYQDGVITKTHDLGVNKWFPDRKDVQRYESDGEYRRGFDDGYERGWTP